MVSLIPECSRLCTPALIVVSVNGRTWFWTLSLATTRNILKRVEMSVTPQWSSLQPCTMSSTEKRWPSSDAVCQQLQRLIQIGYTAGTYEQSKLAIVAAMEELARQIQRCVDAHSDPDNVSCSGSRFYTGSRRPGDALVPSKRRHVARQIKDFWETESAHGGFRGHTWWNSGGSGSDGASAGGKVQAPGADGDKGRGRGRGNVKKGGGGGVVPSQAK